MNAALPRLARSRCCGAAAAVSQSPSLRVAPPNLARHPAAPHRRPVLLRWSAARFGSPNVVAAPRGLVRCFARRPLALEIHGASLSHGAAKLQQTTNDTAAVHPRTRTQQSAHNHTLNTHTSCRRGLATGGGKRICNSVARSRRGVAEARHLFQNCVVLLCCALQNRIEARSGVGHR